MKRELNKYAMLTAGNIRQVNSSISYTFSNQVNWIKTGSFRFLQNGGLSIVLSVMLLSCTSFGRDDSVTPTDDLTAIYAKTFNGYSRKFEADGSVMPESYGVAVGGLITGIPTADEKGFGRPTGDASVDSTTFVEIAGIIEQALSPRNYVPTSNPKNAKLLIVVFWGRTAGTNSFSSAKGAPGLGNKDGAARDVVNQRNAALLGFQNEGHLFDSGFDDTSNMMSNIRRQVHSAALDALEDDRYIVILEAFDFQKIWKEKKPVRLWETRFSLSQRHDNFRAVLPRMAQAAEQMFGTDSQGISYKGVPEGRVEIGPLKDVGVVNEPSVRK